jgi:hypothetical protein
MELVLDEIKVVLHDPVAGELVGAVEGNCLVSFLQKADGVDPQKEGIFWQLRSNLPFDVLPDGLHKKLLMNKKAVRKIVTVQRFPASASLQTGSSTGFPAESGIQG